MYGSIDIIVGVVKDLHFQILLQKSEFFFSCSAVQNLLKNLTT